MKVHTYTNIWSTERKIYAFGDISLPTPVSFKQIGLFILSAIPWFTIMAFTPFSLMSGDPYVVMAWFGPPIALTILGNKKLLEDKSLFEFLGSQISFLMEPKHITDGQSDPTIGKTFRVESRFWSKNYKENN